MIRINEIFYSIQGESTLAGTPTVFIRTTGCNLRCTYCDTTYAYHKGESVTFEQILSVIEKYKTKYVCLTGGEPLLQKDSFELMTQLCDQGYFVSLETSGSLSIAEVDSRVKIILDIKTPDSGAFNFHKENLNHLRTSTEIKFVICSEDDFEWAESFTKKNNLFKKNIVLYSPSFKKIDQKWLAEKIIDKKSSARLQLQLHKYIWSPEFRGV